MWKMKDKRMNLYLAVTKDEYELPVFIEDTIVALSKKVGLSRSVLSRQMCGLIGESRFTPYKYVKVEVEDE